MDPWVWKIPLRRKWRPTPAFLPGKSHGQRSLTGCSSWGCKRERDALFFPFKSLNTVAAKLLQLCPTLCDPIDGSRPITPLITWFYNVVLASLVAQMVKCLPAMLETQVELLGQEDPLEKEMATHSSTLAWRIPWMEKPGAGYSPWGRKELDTTKRLLLTHFVCKALCY